MVPIQHRPGRNQERKPARSQSYFLWGEGVCAVSGHVETFVRLLVRKRQAIPPDSRRVGSRLLVFGDNFIGFEIKGARLRTGTLSTPGSGPAPGALVASCFNITACLIWLSTRNLNDSSRNSSMLGAIAALRHRL